MELVLLKTCVWQTILLFFVCSSVNGIFYGSKLPEGNVLPVTGSPGEPVFVTSYLEDGDVEGGKNASAVPSLYGNVTSYAGFITVNKECNSNLFFWYFPAESSPKESSTYSYAPTLLWLQGGPGASSLYGLFEENGPYFIDEDGEIHRRELSWTKDFNVLYIDSPVGTGFSFTEKEECYAWNDEMIARDIYSALDQFSQLFPELQFSNFYIAGESYAGKTIPHLASIIGEESPFAMNLRGLFIGSGFTDPKNMVACGDYLFQLGLVDTEQLEYIKEIERFIKRLIVGRKFDKALENMSALIDYIAGLGVNVFDFSADELFSWNNSPFVTFVQQDSVRRAIHVGSFVYNIFSRDVYHAMRYGAMQSAVHLLPDLITKYRVLYYDGQYSVISAYQSTENVLSDLSYRGAYKYLKSERRVWYDLNSNIAGYYKQSPSGSLVHVLVRKASFRISYSQPDWTYDLLKNFVFDSNIGHNSL